MATFNLTPWAPDAPTGLAVSGGVKAATLTWDAASVPSYEVWQHTSNVSGGATQVATVNSNAYTPTGLTTGTTYYFWVKAINDFGTASAFSSSVSITPSSITSADTAFSSVSGGVSTSTSTNTPTVSAEDTWYDCGYISFTAGGNGTDIVTLSGDLYLTLSSVTVGLAQVLNVIARSRLYNATDSVDVTGGKKERLVYTNVSGSSWGVLNPIVSFDDCYVAGFRGLLVPGKTYRWYIDVMKESPAGTPTVTVTVNGARFSASTATVT